MKTKTVQQVLAPPPALMVGDGFRVHNFFPGGYHMGNKRMSPFFLLDYNSKVEFPPSETPRGVDVHPHRGFETVTIAYHGKVAHHDSAGNSGVIYPGDVQWMTAGSGILHKEYHEQEFARNGGPFEMVQLWVNLPAKDKGAQPGYQSLTAADIAKVQLPDEAGIVNVIAGSFNSAKGPARTFTDVNLFDIKLNAGGKLSTALPAAHNTAALVIEGEVNINGTTAAEHSFTLFRNEGEDIAIEAAKNSVVLLMSGMPIDEPIASYGPFVMNTQQEIVEAIQDFQSGKFGTLA